MSETQQSLILRLAPALFVVLWSTGWLAARVVVVHAEPLTFLSLRYALAAVILAAAALAMRVEWPRTVGAVGHAMMSGVLLHAMYFAGVWWAVMHGLPLAISALVAALQPLLTALLAPMLVGETITRRQWGGVLLGFAGIALVLRPALSAVPADRLGDFLMPLSVNILGILGATSGTFYQKRFVTTDNLAVVTVLQNAGALAVTLPLAAATESLTISWNIELALAMAWVVLGMSIGAMALLSALLRYGAVSRAATLIYLMPPLVALQAYVLFGETLRPVQIAGIAATVLGVALVLRKP